MVLNKFMICTDESYMSHKEYANPLSGIKVLGEGGRGGGKKY